MNKSTTPLSNTYYYSNKPHLVAVDNIIFGFDVFDEKLKVLLFKRLVEPFADQWSLIGSFVGENENVSTAAERVLYQLTGLKGLFLSELKSYGDIDRDPGNRVISIAHFSLIRISDENVQLREQHDSQWFDIDALPPLVMDHSQMVQDALERLQENARNRPIGFELIPQEFTLRTLKRLYEEIYQRPLDDRNFRKKFLGTGLLNKLDKKDKSTSRKGSFFFSFNKSEYDRLVKDGYPIGFF